MIARPRVCVRLGFLVGCLAASAAAQTLTERQALQMLRESPYYRELQARVEVTRAERRRGTLYPNPSVHAEFEGAGRTDFYRFEQPLAVNGRLRLLRQAGDSAVAATQAEADYELRSIEADVRAAFQELIYAQRRGDAIDRSVDELGELVRILRVREQAGEGSKFDRLRAEREIVERESERVGVEALVAQARARIAGFLGEQLSADGIVAEGTLDASEAVPELRAAIESSLVTRGDYRRQEARLETLRIEALAAGRLSVPNPVLSGGLKRAYNGVGYAHGPIVSVSVDLPLFNKGQAESQLAEVRAAQERESRKVLESRILADVRGAHESLLIRRRAAEQYERDSGRRAEELREIAGIAYTEGELGILELLDSVRVAQQSRLRLLELKAAAKSAEIEFDRATGKEMLP
jgi:cobalt-zinc-cadmium efflux system outer membrane protein